MNIRRRKKTGPIHCNHVGVTVKLKVFIDPEAFGMLMKSFESAMEFRRFDSVEAIANLSIAGDTCDAVKRLKVLCQFIISAKISVKGEERWTFLTKEL